MVDRRLQFVLTGHKNHLDCVDWNAKGDALISGGYDGKLFIWSAKDKFLLQRWIDFGERITFARFSRSGDLIALMNGKTGLVGVWSFPQLTKLWSRQEPIDTGVASQLEWDLKGEPFVVSGRAVTRITAKDSEVIRKMVRSACSLREHLKSSM